MKVTIYCRVSTSDKDQNPETQLLPLREFVGWGVGLRSYSEPWLDTTSPFGEALYYITVAYAQLERGILSERVRAGMERARRQGKQIGRPKVINRRGFQARFGAALQRLNEGRVSRRQAAKELKIGYATLKRLLDTYGKDLNGGTA